MGPPPTVAAWARANPSARDALLAVAERAVALQPAAEVAIQHGRAGAAPPDWALDAKQVLDAYRSLASHLGALGLRAPIAGELRELVDRHAELVDDALQATGQLAERPEGLGPVAGRLVGLRDLLRRTVAIGGRGVSDVTPGV
jgi:hypothetical protein